MFQNNLNKVSNYNNFLAYSVVRLCVTENGFISRLTYLVQLSYLGKMSEARNGKICLKLQILLMLQWLNWYLSTLGEGELPVLLQCLAVSADASSSQTCRRRHMSYNKRVPRHVAPQHDPAAAAGNTRRDLNPYWIKGALAFVCFSFFFFI